LTERPAGQGRVRQRHRCSFEVVKGLRLEGKPTGLPVAAQHAPPALGQQARLARVEERDNVFLAQLHQGNETERPHVNAFGAKYLLCPPFRKTELLLNRIAPSPSLWVRFSSQVLRVRRRNTQTIQQVDVLSPFFESIFRQNFRSRRPLPNGADMISTERPSKGIFPF
jgi:hypothetical protein